MGRNPAEVGQEVLGQIHKIFIPPSVRPTSGLDPWVPTPSDPWDAAKVRHLYRRAAFAPTVTEVAEALQRQPSDVIDTLLATPPQDAPPSWITNRPYPSPLNTQQQTDYNNWIRELREWWIRRMLTRPLNVHEKMVLFWQNHFTSQYSVVGVPQYMALQHLTIRQFAMGNVRDFAKAITVDPAMLVYLDGVRNVVSSPNENYARELQELFTIGIGNYTQTDVQQAARALTGWTINGLNSVFVPSRHDSGVKTFYGQTGNFDANDIVDIIFQRPETASFICRKLYRYFIYEIPDESIVSQLAELLISHDYEIAPVLNVLLKSQLFFDPLIMSAMITSPVEKMVGAIRQLWMTISPTSNVIPSYVRAQTIGMGQNLLEPPNVAGWPGYREWISSTTLPLRNAFTDAIVQGHDINNANIGFCVNALTFARLFPNPNDAVGLVSSIAAHLIPIAVSQRRSDMLLQTLLDGIALYDWNIDDPQAPAHVQGLLKVIFRMAEYQLA